MKVKERYIQKSEASAERLAVARHPSGQSFTEYQALGDQAVENRVERMCKLQAGGARTPERSAGVLLMPPKMGVKERDQMTINPTNAPTCALSVELHKQAGQGRYVLVLKVRGRDGQNFTMRTWPWTGTAMPEGILLDALAVVGRELTEQVMTSVGVQAAIADGPS